MTKVTKQKTQQVEQKTYLLETGVFQVSSLCKEETEKSNFTFSVLRYTFFLASKLLTTKL